jgi:hypothetical protein
MWSGKSEKRRRGEEETRRRGDGETRRRGDEEIDYLTNKNFK